MHAPRLDTNGGARCLNGKAARHAVSDIASDPDTCSRQMRLNTYYCCIISARHDECSEGRCVGGDDDVCTTRFCFHSGLYGSRADVHDGTDAAYSSGTDTYDNYDGAYNVGAGMAQQPHRELSPPRRT